MRAGQKDRVFDVDWKYVPGQDVPPQPKGTKVCYCSAYFGPNGGENLAFSDSFEAPESTDLNRVRDDFVKFIREKYSAKDANGGCSSEDKAKEAHNMRSKKIIETGWKPKSLPPVVRRGPSTPLLGREDKTHAPSHPAVVLWPRTLEHFHFGTGGMGTRTGRSCARCAP